MTTELKFCNLIAKPGEKAKGYITVPGTDSPLPVAILNGKEDGKIFLITASIHGFEYPGIQTAAELIRELNPAEMSGAVIIIPVVNRSGFYGRHPYICPEDEENKNLNKVGPGRPDGTFAERLIYFLEETFVKKCDFHLDLHSGDATEQLLHFCAIGNMPNEEQRAFVHDLIHHLNFEYHTQSSGSCEFYNASAKYSGVPAMMFECGGNGNWSRSEVEFEKDNIRRIMQMLSIIPGDAPFNPDVKCIERQSWIGCSAEGFFYSFCKVGDEVRKGQKLYEIRDVWGELLEEHFAAYDAKVFIVNSTLGVSKDDDAIFYGSIKENEHDHSCHICHS